MAASMASSGSPTPRKVAVHFDTSESRSSSSTGDFEIGMANAQSENTLPLKTSKMANQQPFSKGSAISEKRKCSASGGVENETSKIEQILQKVSQVGMDRCKTGKPCTSTLNSGAGASTSCPGATSQQSTHAEGVAGQRQDENEVVRLKQELEAAQDRIALMDQELSQSRITKHTFEQAVGSPAEVNLREVTEQLMNKLQSCPPRASAAGFPDEARSEHNAACSPKTSDSFSNAWNDPGLSTYGNVPMNESVQNTGPWNAGMSQGQGPQMHCRYAPQPQRPANLRLDTFNSSYDQGFAQGFRRTNGPFGRPGSGMGHFQGSWNSYPASVASSTHGSPPMTPASFQAMNVGHGSAPYQPRPIGTPLSPTAVEFSSDPMGNAGPLVANPWNTQPGAIANPGSAYMPPVEPMNYRRLLDRNMSCNWKYIVDKIVCSNDQQASIFLQQKLKVATPEQKYEMVEAIIAQAYPLMINRFGNFLVQRCFEHGAPEQVIAIANAIRGNTLALSMDAFGCHVVQKAFDVVPEDYKAIMVHELLRRIPETVIHRYACHVWQKLFELRWSDSPPQIMKYVNEALRGMWHEVALGETGSLVVQNIFENCLEEDKRPCVEEVLASIDIVAHGQFGNWCIQHICEHGAPADKSRAIEHVLRFATEYSTDQFASKVVEKCLKVGGTDFLDRYLEKVCEGRPDRPRMPLIDISGDQYGNYLIQFILLHSDPQHREMVAQHVRKHMVSLRGSKFGSRVAMLCCNPAYATRPGPPMAMPVTNRFFPNNNAVGLTQQAPPGAWR